MHKLTKKWWNQNKKDYVFDPQWFKAFEKIEGFSDRLKLPRDASGALEMGKLGVVFWHEPDGKTIIPVGVTFREDTPEKFSEFIFCYHPDYVADPHTKAISVSLPKTTTPYVQSGDYISFIPYFDNLVAEGYLGLAQRNAYHSMSDKKDVITSLKEFELDDMANERYARLLMFGRGFHGAISVVDVAAPDNLLKQEEELEHTLLAQTSIGGGQPKGLAIKKGKQYQPVMRDDVSTHIVKLRQDTFYPNILENEYLTTLATKTLLSNDQTAEVEMAMYVNEYGAADKALFIKRFDRLPNGGRVHFEEALQIANGQSGGKYEYSYKTLADITRKLVGESAVPVMFKRVLSQFMLGNFDGHMKNFAFWEQNGKWQMTPNYDLVCDDMYAHMDGKTPLFIAGRKHVRITPKVILDLGKEFGMSVDQVKAAAEELRERLPLVHKAIMNDEMPFIADEFKEDLRHRIDARSKFMFEGFDRCCEIERSTPSSGHKMG